MKLLIKYLPLCMMLWLCTSCKPDAPKFTTEIALIVDKTDRMSRYPDADEITSQLGLQENPWQGIRITATFISDTDINDIAVISLESENEWSGNIVIRRAKIAHFIKQLRQCLANMAYSGTRPYSIVFRSVARQVNRLAASNAPNKLLLVYSDLYENDADITFYDRKVISLLQKSPQSIAARLERTMPLKQLSGIQVWLLYNPISLSQNDSYMIIAGFYQHLFAAHGAVTHIANKFQPL